jgi:hypothetical protein
MPRQVAYPAVLCAALLGAGCSLTAKKTPTPAAQLRTEELAALPHPANERYYLLLFGSNDVLRRPKYTHTWATVVRTVCTPGGGEPVVAEVVTISWLPVGLDIHPLDFCVEPGQNVELHETIRNSLQTGQNIAMWGPYEVWHGFHTRFGVQKAFLDSERVGYQMIDTVGEAARTGNGCDCIHAISDMDPQYPRWRYPLAVYGIPATANLVRRLMHAGVFIDPPATHDWLIPRLGLDRYPIECRQYLGRAKPYVPGGGELEAPPLAPQPAAPPPSQPPAAPTGEKKPR